MLSLPTEHTGVIGLKGSRELIGVARYAECPVLIARRAAHRMSVNAQARASEALPIPPGS
jgi:hypothetical protein